MADPPRVTATVTLWASVPANVAVTLTRPAASDSPKAVLSTLRTTDEGSPSSSTMVVWTNWVVLSSGVGPPPPCGLDILNSKYRLASSSVLSVVATVTVADVCPAGMVTVPLAAV